jgi:hypothetical protein
MFPEMAMRQNRLYCKQLVRVLLLPLSLLVCVMSFHSHAEEKKVETLDEVTIIGNTELPKVIFDEPWQLPSTEKSVDKSLPKDLPGVLEPIEPYRYKQQLHFSHYLEVDVESFKAR